MSREKSLRRILICVALIIVVGSVMNGVAFAYGINIGLYNLALGTTCLVLSSAFTRMGENVIEDVIKSLMIATSGLLFVCVIPLPWCLMPGAAAVIASLVNVSIYGIR